MSIKIKRNMVVNFQNVLTKAKIRSKIMIKFIGMLQLFILLTWVNAFAEYPSDMKSIRQAEYEYLDQLALDAGADKASSFHNYTKVYADFFGPIKNEPLVFLEIGIYKGNSVKLWESYFPNATLYFIDNNPSYIEYFSPRSHYHFMDQTDWFTVHAFAKSVVRGFDIILDDAGHTMVAQIGGFQTLFPYLKSGGLYIIEDLHTSYWQAFGGGGTFEAPKSGPGTCVHFLQSLVDELNFSGARTQCADANKIPPDIQQTLNYWQDQIESIHFYKSVCIIRKK